MSIESEIFKKSVPNFKKIKQYGFLKTADAYICEKIFMGGDFRAVIRINNTGTVSGTVYDTENNEEYLPLRYENPEGAFIGEVRELYSKILTDIKENCFSENYFAGSQTNRITELIFKVFGDNPVFPWKDDPSGVFKNPDTNKWYGIVMNIPYSKLGEKSSELVDVINLKLDKDKIPELVKRDGIYPAWHMNKIYWVSVTLDDSLSDDEIMLLIEESHSYSVKK
ncbi:MmcQ/YjbR family DNA-binding protein [bacterium]|nr:MmcQ/YjbR family DNA-binding protein [bacterium]